MIEVHLYRPPSGGAVAYEQWQDDASCVDHDPDLFEIDDPVHLLTSGEEEEQHKRIAKGLSVCVGCPVRAACKANSTEQDRYWTTRGGQPPEGLFHARMGPKVKRVPKSRGKKCKKGHDLWVVSSRGKNICSPCQKVQNLKDYKIRRGLQSEK